MEVEEKKEEKKVKAVMFTTYTHSSILAKKLRESEEKLGELTGYKIKVVERAGTKLVDLLTSSNPWGGTDCRREFCLLCETKEKTGRNKGQDCRKRFCVYEIWCKQCEDEDEMRIDDQYSEEEKVEKKEEIRKKKEEMKRYKYIGETSRSIYERAWEHQNGLASLDKDSYMLKHFLDRHEEEDLKVRRFAVKVIKFTRTSFDRQILESVQLQNNRNHNLLNSKSEFNRCAIPRLSSKLGEKEYKQYSEEEKEEKERSLIIESKIRKIRKEMSKVRRSEDEEEMGMRLPVNKKRRKLETKDEEKKADKEERMESRQRKLMRNWLKNEQHGVGDDDRDEEDDSTTETISQKVQDEEEISPKCTCEEKISPKCHCEGRISPKCNYEEEYSTTEINIISQSVQEENEISPKYNSEEVISPKCNDEEDCSTTEIISQTVQIEEVLSPEGNSDECGWAELKMKCNIEDNYSTTEILSQIVQVREVLSPERNIDECCWAEMKLVADECGQAEPHDPDKQTPMITECGYEMSPAEQTECGRTECGQAEPHDPDKQTSKIAECGSELNQAGQAECGIRVCEKLGKIIEKKSMQKISTESGSKLSPAEQTECGILVCEKLGKSLEKKSMKKISDYFMKIKSEAECGDEPAEEVKRRIGAECGEGPVASVGRIGLGLVPSVGRSAEEVKISVVKNRSLNDESERYPRLQKTEKLNLKTECDTGKKLNLKNECDTAKLSQKTARQKKFREIQRIKSKKRLDKVDLDQKKKKVCKTKNGETLKKIGPKSWQARVVDECGNVKWIWVKEIGLQISSRVRIKSDFRRQKVDKKEKVLKNVKMWDVDEDLKMKIVEKMTRLEENAQETLKMEKKLGKK